MRNLKFRAWEPDTKKMVDVFGINPMVQKVYLSHQQLFGTSGDDLLLSYAPDDEFSYVRLMQSTGLKDRSGVEIYEGDVVKQSDGNGVVEWRGAAWGYSNVMWHDKYEVIGNIYENPELLTKDTHNE